MAAGAETEQAANLPLIGRPSGSPAGCTRSPRQQEAPERRVAGTEPGCHEPAPGARQNPCYGGGDFVSIRQLVEDFGRYHYLPRLRNPAALLDAIQNGINLSTWEIDSFAYAVTMILLDDTRGSAAARSSPSARAMAHCLCVPRSSARQLGKLILGRHPWHSRSRYRLALGR